MDHRPASDRLDDQQGARGDDPTEAVRAVGGEGAPGDPGDRSPAAAPAGRTRTGAGAGGRGSGAASRSGRSGTGGPARTADRNLPLAVGVGVALAVAAIVTLSIGPAWGVGFVTFVVTLCAAELFGALRRARFQPATLLGLVAVPALVLAAYWKGEVALPLVLVLTVAFTFLWYLVGVSRSSPTRNAGVTLAAVAYVGLFGSFAALMLRLPDGTGILLGVAVAVVANDVGALFAGKRFGRSRLAPTISPNKTFEGALGGALASIVASFVVLDLIGLHPWDAKGGSALALGVLVAVLAPIGDLVESMIKRDLDVKDMGSILPGHGGLIDRFDSILFVLPAAYYLVRLLELLSATPTTVAVVGSTGSIGTQALDVVRAEPGRYEVVALGAGGANLDLLVAQAEEHRPAVVAVADPARAAELAERLPWCEVRSGGTGAATALASLCDGADVVVNGVVGFAGLPVTLATLAAGRRLALANKESLIAAGPLVAEVRGTPGAEVLPVDSEHCALHQCLRAGGPREVAALVLTASGGPFRGRTRAELAEVTVEGALAHPTWRMGPKITVDSSTLMNKGLEVIEAHELFGTPYDAIDVVVHPQSVVHSMVTFTDGATIAQLSLPDMRLPIAYALGYPDRSPVPVGAVDWASVGSLDFEAPDREAFPCLDLAYDAGRAGGSAPAWLNAANEVAVEAFLDGRLAWTAIPEVLKECLDRHDGTSMDDVTVVIDIDRRARTLARTVVERRSGS